jgi:hypothetical protein
VRHIDARRDNDDKSSLTFFSYTVETESQDWRADRRDSGTSHHTLVQFAHFAYVTASDGCLLLLGDPINDNSATVVGHCCDVFGKVGLRDALSRRQLPFSVKVIGLFESLINRLIKHLVKQRSRLAAEQSM